MALPRYIILAAALSLMLANSAASTVKSAPNLQTMIDEENARCESGEDTMACIKVRAMRFLDTVITKENFKISDVEIRTNGYKASTPVTGRSNDGGDFYDTIENYIQSHDVTMSLPVIGDAKVTMSSRKLADNELSLSVKFADTEDVVEGKGKKGNIFKKGKKHRLRKMAMPIMVLILLKAMTIIPMAIGILKIKALNALALGFFSFIVSVGLAIFQLCKKLATDHHHTAHITAHGPWDGRSIVPSLDDPINGAQNLAYNAYA